MQANGDTTQAKPVKRPEPRLFYKKPVLLRPGPNARSGLTPANGYAFARSAASVPIGVSEFPRVARHYPIMFVATDLVAMDLVAVAVLGLTPSSNLFVEPDGSWRPGHYVPAYIRQYPFTLAAMPGCNEPMLAIDTASDRFVRDSDRAEGANRLFDDAGQPTGTTRSATAFCQAYRDDCERTKAFTEALRRAELLVRRQLPTGLPDESGFLNIDDQVFRKLTELSVTRWQGDSWLLLIALAVASARNWPSLTNLHRHRTEQGEPA